MEEVTIKKAAPNFAMSFEFQTGRRRRKASSLQIESNLKAASNSQVGIFRLHPLHESKMTRLQTQEKMISPKITKTKQTSSFLAIFTMACLLFIASSLQTCICDTRTTKESKSAFERAKDYDSSESKVTSAKRVARDSISRGSSASKEREQMLSYLAEEVERRHSGLLMGPQTFKRPSKFDDGRPASKLSVPVTSGQSSSYSSASTRFGPRFPVRKFDDGMSKIYQMHEIASVGKTKLQLNSGSEQVGGDTSEFSTTKISLRAPRLSSSATSKLVSSVITYVSPKLANTTLGFSSRVKKYPTFGNYISKLTNFNQMPVSTKAPAVQLPYLLRPPSKYSLPTRFPLIGQLMSNRLEVQPESSKQQQQVEQLSDPIVSTSQSLSGNRPRKAPKSLKTSSAAALATISSPSSWLSSPLIQNSLRDLLTLSQLPILASKPLPSTAPSIFENGGRRSQSGDSDQDKILSASGIPTEPTKLLPRLQFIEEAYRLLNTLAVAVRNKREPLLGIGSDTNSAQAASSYLSDSSAKRQGFTQRSMNQLAAWASQNQNQVARYIENIRSLLPHSQASKAKPRGVMWEMATDPSLAVTVFHLLEKASVALPLGFMLMPIVRMIRNPLGNVQLINLMPPRASHRSVDYEELAKRLDLVDKMLSRALRSAHREI